MTTRSRTFKAAHVDWTYYRDWLERLEAEVHNGEREHWARLHADVACNLNEED